AYQAGDESLPRFDGTLDLYAAAPRDRVLSVDSFGNITFTDPFCYGDKRVIGGEGFISNVALNPVAVAYGFCTVTTFTDNFEPGYEPSQSFSGLAENTWHRGKESPHYFLCPSLERVSYGSRFFSY